LIENAFDELNIDEGHEDSFSGQLLEVRRVRFIPVRDGTAFTRLLAIELVHEMNLPRYRN